MLKKIKKKNPLVHCITNPISITQCANTVLSIGARPIMAEHPFEVEEITKTADSLLLNLGNITDARMKAMQISLKTAKKNKIPITLDLVGVACSRLRRKFAHKLIKKYRPSVIKGNYSEIYAFYNPDYKSNGVDASENLNSEIMSKVSASLAKKYNFIVLASGKIDIVSDGNKTIHIKNGVSQLACVTGTGCMLGALCACFLTVCSGFEAVVNACAVLGICGEKAKTDKGCGSFINNLIDELSNISQEKIDKHIKMEEIQLEKN